jgi:hypothetical protein
VIETALGIFLIGELCVALPAFGLINVTIGPDRSKRWYMGAVAKGVLERAMMLLGLLLGFPHVLTALAAIKLGTRLQRDKDSEVSNNYFYIGNVLSILLALAYTMTARAV